MNFVAYCVTVQIKKKYYFKFGFILSFFLLYFIHISYKKNSMMLYFEKIDYTKNKIMRNEF